jgi:hypothetical protein
MFIKPPAHSGGWGLLAISTLNSPRGIPFPKSNQNQEKTGNRHVRFTRRKRTFAVQLGMSALCQ